ncbi:terminase large subunit domain-containing protein, partial [Acetobacter nitrogenifigens]|uniref:terminase large subunit domain-containing protein n=1 Tax=Acetobacter nitrogenifigens TaxID=285268 RepID=UPI001FF079F9
LSNPELAAKALRCFKRLRIPDVPGAPAMADACGNWFFEIVTALFGSLAPATSERMVRELFLLVPKKNSKTTNGAGLMITAVIVNERPNAEFLIVAPTKEIADLAFGQASGMVEQDRELAKRFHLQQHLKKLTFRPTGATLQIKAFSPDVMTGVKPAGVLVDEQHVIAAKSDAASVMRQIRGGMISQPEAFLAIITTQSDGPPRGVFQKDLIRAREIRDGKRKGPVLPVLYELPPSIQQPSKLPGEAAPWEDPAVWPMVLPNLGRSITLARLRQEFDDVREKGVEEMASWASQHLNVEIGLALR